MLGTQQPEIDSKEFAGKLESVQKIIQGRQFHEALTALQVMLDAKPDDAEALYMTAVCLRYTQQHQAAIETLSRLKSIRPSMAALIRKKPTRCERWAKSAKR